MRQNDFSGTERRFGSRTDLRHSAGVPKDDDTQRRESGAQLKAPDPRRRKLGELIKITRLARHYSSQRRLARAAGISERSVAGVEAGEFVGPRVLAAIEGVFDWPVCKTTEYLEGDDDALEALPPRGSYTMNAVAKEMTEAGLTMDVVPAPDVDWLRDLRARLPWEQFIQVVDQMTRPPRDRT